MFTKHRVRYLMFTLPFTVLLTIFICVMVPKVLYYLYPGIDGFGLFAASLLCIVTITVTSGVRLFLGWAVSEVKDDQELEWRKKYEEE